MARLAFAMLDAKVKNYAYCEQLFHNISVPNMAHLVVALVAVGHPLTPMGHPLTPHGNPPYNPSQFTSYGHRCNSWRVLGPH